MTTRRENMLKIFRHETPEWVPVTGHCDPYNQPNREGMDPELAEALGEVQWGDTSTIALSRYLGLEIMDLYGLPVRVTRQNVTNETTCEGDVITTDWHTPAGDLHEVIGICRDVTGAVSSNHTEHAVKGPEDLPALAAIFEDEILEPDPDALAATRAQRELIGDDGMLLGAMAGTPMGMMYRQYSGVATLSYLWADAPDALRDLFAVMEKNYLQCLAIGAQSDVDAVVGIDDTSTTAISPEMFEAFNMDLTDARTDAAHAAGKLYFHHSCGHIRNLLGLYAQTRMDGVHAFCTPPVGDVTIAEGRQTLGDKVTIMTGVHQLSGPLDDRAAVRASIHEMIRQADPGDHFILLTAGYPNRTIEQTQFVIDCCREAGGRPTAA